MKRFFQFLLLIFSIITGYYCYKKYQERIQREKELEELRLKNLEKKRKELCDFYQSKLSRIETANNQFEAYLDLNLAYFSNYQMRSWEKNHAMLFNEIKNQPYENIDLKTTEVDIIKKFINQFENADDIRNKFNEQFIKQELKNHCSFFENIEGRKLDLQQRTSVVTDDDNNIVIAGAGSGKTTTIIGKVNYVINRYKIDPSEILLISFTNKSATTLANRINAEGVEAKTFHKFGKDIIAEVETKQPSISDEKQYNPLISKYFKELIRDETYLKKLTQFFTDFLKPPKSQFDFNNNGDYIQYLKDKNFKTYKVKEVAVRGRKTYKMEIVKSIEECKIANFLLFNGLDYEYEFPYEHDTATQAYRQYKPDFTIMHSGKKVYIEHLAVSKNGDVPPFFAREGETLKEAKERYWEKIYWAREMHESHGTELIETYSYEMKEDTLFENLTQNLLKVGIILKPKPPEEIWKIISEAAQDEVASFVTLFQTFITLMKSNNYSINDVIKKNSQTGEIFFQKRNALFIEIIRPICESYANYLAERKEIDFSDMINKATSYILNGKYKRNFKYVIIDEFQDISVGRYQLVKAIKTKNPACKLFCVGDDWQSIYRFTGSDITLFKEFEKYFGFTVKSKIETTYRFQNPLLNLSSEFIQKNPNQAPKELKATNLKSKTNYKIQYSVSDNQDDTLALSEIFNELIRTTKGIEQKEIFVLGRYGFDINRIKNENNTFKIDQNTGIITYRSILENDKTVSLKSQFATVHKAKGLEADIVIILNCNSGKHGFPSEMSDDPVLNLLLSEADQFENGEERRLFYVAMTRAKENVYFVTDSSYKSKFIAELEIESGNTDIKKCPLCITADLVKRSGTKNDRPWAFYGCTNFMYGCDYQEWVN